jgi:hypothetical protein
MSAIGDSWEDDGDFTEFGIINDPLKEKTPVNVGYIGTDFQEGLKNLLRQRLKRHQLQ